MRIARDIVIFADESAKEGAYYCNFYGGALILESRLAEAERRLNAIKTAHHLYNEIKWQKVTKAYLAKYIAVIDELFDLVDEGVVKIRIMFSHRHMAPQRLRPEHVRDRYWILYYLFFKHAFGLGYLPADHVPCRLTLLLDDLPDSGARRATFKRHLLRIQRRLPGVTLHAQDIREVDSHRYALLQSIDIVLGAMQFRLNDQYLEKQQNGRRGARTLAKLKLYKHINRRIQQTHGSQFNVGVSTGQANGKSDRWLHRYRHWVFTSKNSVRDRTIVKPRNKRARLSATPEGSIPSGT